MSILDLFRPKKKPVERHRSLASLVQGKMRQSWVLASSEPNAVGATAKTIRQMARDLEESNAYAIAFLREFRMNVVGPEGIKFQSRAARPRGAPDEMARRAVETAFSEWKKSCTVTGDMSYADASAMIAAAYARDGQVFIRHVRGWDNKFGYAIQLIDADMLAETHCVAESNGTRIVYGKEIDQWDRVTAVWLYKSHPDDSMSRSGYGEMRRVPIADIIDYYVQSRIGRFTGLSLLRGAIEYLKQLKDFEAAELVAAKASACAFASIEKDPGTVDEESPDFPAGGKQMTIEPGTVWDALPPGWKVKYHKAEHPNTNLDGFRKAILRGIAASVGSTYNTLAHDLQGVNYSSLREGRLLQNDIWKAAQAAHIRRVEEPIFREWLKSALLMGAIPGYSIDNLQYLSTAIWQGRRWAWVDPTKDAAATMMQLNNKLTTVRQVLAERDGVDLDDFLAELTLERKLFESLGIEHPSETDATGDVAAVEETGEQPTVDPEEPDDEPA